MKLDLLITFSICMESCGAPYTNDCRLLNRLKKSLFLDRVEEVRLELWRRSGMISKGGGGQLSPMFRHVPSRLRQVSCVLVAVVVVVADEGELAPFPYL